MNIVITGGSRGIGVEAVRHFAAQGHRVRFLYEKSHGAAQAVARETGAEVTDDCSAVELMGMSVKVMVGDERNLKITTPMDLRIAEMLLEEMK